MQLEKRKISELKNWEENPRKATPEDIDRLVQQITELGQYKPLIVNKDDVVLGGNMRLQALRKIAKDEDIEVWVSVIDAQDQKKMVEYALSDNDRAGKYDLEKLKYIMKDQEDMFSNFHVEIGETVALDFLFRAGDTDLDDFLENLDTDDPYVKGTIKKMAIYFDDEEYKKTLYRLERVITQYDLSDNSQALLKLLELWESKV